MIVPAFSMNGNLIVVQIVPGEETSTPSSVTPSFLFSILKLVEADLQKPCG